MCGICGILSLDPNTSVEMTHLQQMCDLISHRGPDDQGFLHEQAIGLGMRRLSIIDLSGGHQPIFNETGSISIVFNGEIYNHQDIRTELEKRGHRFVSRSDTEAIVHAYEEWGEDCVRQLRGMFGFAIWDREKGKLFIARDRMGQKPLYYYRDDQWFIFGSEIKSILSFAFVPRQTNLKALDTYLSLGYIPAPETMFNGIYKLPAAHTLSITQDQYNIQPYWDIVYDDPSKNGKPKTEQEYAECLQGLLQDAVRARLMSDVPLKAFLSEGIDSSMIVALMSQIMNRPVDTFSVGFQEQEMNELPFAGIAARSFGTHHHEIIVDSCTPDLLQKLIWHLDEPVADPAAVPTFMVSKLARQTVKVVLTGEGGDELFAGYSYYRAHKAPFLPVSLNQHIKPALAKAVNTVSGRERYHNRTIWHWSLPPGEQMLAWVAIFTDEEKRLIYNPALRSALLGKDARTTFARYYQGQKTPDSLHRLLYIDSKVWLPDDLLMKVDKMSMANSIEARSPFMDHHLVEFVASMPSRLKLNGNASKYILKKVAQTILPKEIFNRPKHSFDVPIGRWLRGSLRELTLQILAEGIVPGQPLFDEQYLSRTMWQKLENDQPGYARQYWTLLNLALWIREFGVTVA